MSTNLNPHMDFLKDYFTYDWPSSRTAGLDRYYWTGFKLIEEIRALISSINLNPVQ